MWQRWLLHDLFFSMARTVQRLSPRSTRAFSASSFFHTGRTREKHFLPVLADIGLQMVTAHGHKIPVLKITAADQCQRGCLHRPSEWLPMPAAIPRAMLAFTPVQSASCVPSPPGRGCRSRCPLSDFETVRMAFSVRRISTGAGPVYGNRDSPGDPGDRFSSTPRVRGYDKPVGVFKQPASTSDCRVATGSVTYPPPS